MPHGPGVRWYRPAECHRPPHNPSEYRSRTTGGWVLRVQGEVDTATAPRMAEVLDTQLASECRVVLDLSSVEFMDLHGLAVLMRAARRDRARFGVAQPSACVVRVLDLIHADGEVPILPDGTDPLGAA